MATTTRRRKRAVLVAVRGGLLVVLAVVLHAFGYLAPLESLLYDERVRHCQGYQPPPAPQLVHLDIDDNTLNDVGHWPWPRPVLARIIDEVARAGPKMVMMDVLFDEPVDGDDVLAAAFHRLGCGLIPVSFQFDAPAPPSKARRLLLPVLVRDPEKTEAQCLRLLGPSGLTAADLTRDPADSFSEIRQAAFRERIWRELSQAGGATSQPADLRDTIRRRMLPHDDPLMTSTVLGRLFDEEYARGLSRWSVQRFTVPAAAAGATPVLSATSEQTPVPAFGRVAARSGYVDYLPESVEGTVRTVPLLARYGDQLWPHVDLVAACVALGADVTKVRLADDALTIPRPAAAGGDVVVPVSVRDSPVVGQVGALMEVPLFGRPRDWLTMYDVPAHRRPARHVSVDDVWQVCQTVDQIDRNTASVDRLMRDALLQTDPAGYREYAAVPPAGDALRERARGEVDVVNGAVAISADDPDTAKTPEGRAGLDNLKRIAARLPVLLDQNDALRAQLAGQRAGLRDRLHAGVVFFGTTATGLGDIKPTSLFGPTPGIVVHGAVFNAIVTGKTWRRTSDAVGVSITAAVGLLTLLLVARLPPAGAFVAAVGLGLGYEWVNGYVLFARHNLIVDAAGPAVAVGLVYMLMTLGNYLTDRSDRARIMRRLRANEDPAIVDYFMEHQELDRLDGERREMTIGFSDLVGFTTLSDELGERVVPLLAEYVGQMLPVIRGQQGRLDKQIGDGLCFFFGAPWPDADHARHAVAAALGMHAALVGFNRSLWARGLPELGMRIGLATGDVIVGDAGPPNTASYTTLGGTTNLAARLESANKAFGTRTLVTARTVDLLGGAFLCRPIANLRVAGKLNCTVVYEPLCPAADATDADRHLAACTTAVFDAYRRGHFIACAQAVADMEAAFGPSKFTRLYAERSAEPYHEQDHCDGQIVLTEK